MASSPSSARRKAFFSPALPSAISMKMTSFSSSSTTRMVWVVNASIKLGFAQSQPEPASATKLRFNADRAVHAFRRFAHDRQADAGSRVIPRAADADENGPDALVVPWVDTDAVVLDPQADVVLD